MIKVTQLSYSYGSKKVLEDINFTVGQGEKCALIGRNGAGKSTLIKLMLNMEKTKKGTVSFNEQSNQQESWKTFVSYLPEKFKLYQSLTPIENLVFFNRLNPTQQPIEKIESILKQVSLFEDKDTPIHQFSKGMLQRLGLAMILLFDTDIIILDEPTSGLDPIGRNEILSLIKQMEDKTVLLSSHHFEEVKEICTHVLMLEDGHISKMDIATFEHQYIRG
ncbi:ABC transporter ATP-binding protein [Macrococcus sp. DPC7161]|uniref:ABC transporter ATP-binding protein n=1 Tax=Macrococcus sp. DPC7161 TaxID=2507060 RepID=UPI00100AA098|nr:ABC transporter ATP-binding protein [Macrococcus sp. DPC7161]RXK18472.1 ABC transporter ATP-binding protein [Macrococcus sp. DPC7161]